MKDVFSYLSLGTVEFVAALHPTARLVYLSNIVANDIDLRIVYAHEIAQLIENYSVSLCALEDNTLLILIPIMLSYDRTLAVQRLRIHRIARAIYRYEQDRSSSEGSEEIKRRAYNVSYEILKQELQELRHHSEVEAIGNPKTYNTPLSESRSNVNYEVDILKIAGESLHSAPIASCKRCANPIMNVEELYSCPKCDASYHRTCWEQYHKCSVHGCHSSVTGITQLRNRFFGFFR
jgi:hypothetical protein